MSVFAEAVWCNGGGGSCAETARRAVAAITPLPLYAVVVADADAEADDTEPPPLFLDLDEIDRYGERTGFRETTGRRGGGAGRERWLKKRNGQGEAAGRNEQGLRDTRHVRRKNKRARERRKDAENRETRSDEVDRDANRARAKERDCERRGGENETSERLRKRAREGERVKEKRDQYAYYAETKRSGVSITLIERRRERTLKEKQKMGEGQR